MAERVLTIPRCITRTSGWRRRATAVSREAGFARRTLVTSPHIVQDVPADVLTHGNASKSSESVSYGRTAAPSSLSERRDAIRQAKPFSEFLTDNFNRQHDYLRISVTERCNLRCLYCMPEEGIELSPQSHILTTPEIVYLSSLFVSQGVNKIRLTGGEPTVRRDIVPLMKQIGELRSKGLKELALTTNGISLFRKLDAMAEAGLTGVNLSLDTLDPFQFQIMTRRKGFDQVMKSVDRILQMKRLGANIKLKINCVVMRGLNSREILPFVEMTREKDVEVRFIEYMPFGGNKWSEGKMMGYAEMLDIIREKYPDLERLPGHRNDTAKTYAVPGFAGRVGFITSMTNDFCGTCNRLRITSDGNLKVCLHGNTEVSLRDLLREGNEGQPIDEAAFERLKQIEIARRLNNIPIDDRTPLGWGPREQSLLTLIGSAVKRKKEKHAGIGELELMENRPMILIGNAMCSESRQYSSRTSNFRFPSSSTQNRRPQIPLHLLSPSTPSGLAFPYGSRFRSTNASLRTSKSGSYTNASTSGRENRQPFRKVYTSDAAVYTQFTERQAQRQYDSTTQENKPEPSATIVRSQKARPVDEQNDIFAEVRMMLEELEQTDAKRVSRAIVRMQDISASVRRAIATIRTEIYLLVKSVASDSWTASRTNNLKSDDTSQKLGPYRVTMERVRQVMKSRIAQLQGFTYRVRSLERTVGEYEQRLLNARIDLARCGGQQFLGPTMRLNLSTGVGTVRSSRQDEGTRRQQAMLQFSKRKALASPSPPARMQALDQRKGVHSLASPKGVSHAMARRVYSTNGPPLADTSQISSHEQTDDASQDATASLDDSHNEGSELISANETLISLMAEYWQSGNGSTAIRRSELLVKQFAWQRTKETIKKLIGLPRESFESFQASAADRPYLYGDYCEKALEDLVAACNLIERNIDSRKAYCTTWDAHTIEMNLDFLERLHLNGSRSLVVYLLDRCKESGVSSLGQQMMEILPLTTVGSKIPKRGSFWRNPEMADRLSASLPKCITLYKDFLSKGAQSSTSSTEVVKETAQPATWSAADPLESLESQPELTLPHLTSSGAAHMVNVGDKAPTQRIAIAKSAVRMRKETLQAIKNNALKKGDVISVARLAGIMGAKRCSDLIPLCHPIAISGVEVDLVLMPSADKGDLDSILIYAAVTTTGQTGVEMEALSAVTAAALTVYDMIKSIDKEAMIGNTYLTYKDGGRSGRFISRMIRKYPQKRKGFSDFVASSPTLSSMVVLDYGDALRRKEASGRKPAVSSSSPRDDAMLKYAIKSGRLADTSRAPLATHPAERKIVARRRKEARRANSSLRNRPFRTLNPPARTSRPPPNASSSGLERVLDDD